MVCDKQLIFLIEQFEKLICYTCKPCIIIQFVVPNKYNIVNNDSDIHYNYDKFNFIDNTMFNKYLDLGKNFFRI